MAKKDKKNKKQQPGDWSDDDAPKSAKPAAAVPANGASDDEDEPAPTAQRSKFSFASFGDEPADANDDDDDDGGGLMSAVRASEKRKKDKKNKKKAKAADIDEEDDFAAESKQQDDAEPEVDLASKAPVEMTTDQLMEEEFGPVKPKGGKGKKGKKGKAQQPDDFDEDAFLAEEAAKAMALNAAKAQETAPAAQEQPATPAKAEVEDAGDDDEGEGVTKVLSKKEKEKLKKEKEKAKKKAQAAAKKASGAPQTDEIEAASTTPAQDAPADPAGAEAAIDEGEEEDGITSRNKKKKKKGAAQKAEEAAAAAKAAPAKKVPAHIAAMRAALEKQKAAEEEARRKEEEERRRIEEEEARLAEIERQKEEEKKRKKEKEKAKKEQLKKEGKYMTPKQKQEAAAAAARRDAMIASGQIKVEGLSGADATEAPKPKKVSYGKKKPAKKVPAATAAEAASPAPSSPTAEEQTIAEDETRTEDHEPSHVEAVKAAVPDDVKEDWEMSSEDEASSKPNGNPQEELDDWDAESSEEEAKPPAKAEPAKAAAKPAAEAAKPAASAKPAVNGGTAKPSAPSAAPAATSKATPASTSKAAPAGKAAPASKAPPAAPAAKQEESEESSEEDDDDSSEEDSDDDSDDDSDSDSEEERISKAKQMEAKRKAEAAARREQQKKDAIAAGSKDNLRSPICCILGHVDTGKTKLLDKIRQTNVQEGEAGGITQQIGATFFPMETIQSKTAILGENDLKEYKLPGLLIIDTPGHESFTNLRTRGSSICNIAVLVVDIMHGLEPQTLESIRLLRDGKTPFIVALNKIDRLYGWQPIPNNSFRESLSKQGRSVQSEFEKRLSDTMLAFAEQGLNAIPYYDNKNFAKNVSLVPTSAHTGEGIPDLLMLLIKLTQERMSSQLMYISNLECTVLEVKVIEGLGTTLDVILVNGVMREGDKIVVCGLNGPIVTQVRALLTPQPLKELRIKGQYVHHQVVKASLGIKIVAPDLDKAIAGSRLLVVGPDDDEEDMMEEVMEDLQTIMKSVDKSGKGVYVQASTLGALEALLEFLRTSKIPVSGINIGGVFKRDIIRAATMVERAPEFAIVLAFDVEVDKEARKIADEMGVKIFTADIIYHLFDQFTAHQAAVLEEKRKDSAPNAIWPCRLKILKCFAKRDPIILGCDIIEGSLRVGTPLCVVKMDPETKKKDIVVLGKVTGLEINHKPSEIVKKSQVGAGVAVKIEHASYQPSRLFGRHFDEKSEVISHISRSSIDTLKELFREEVPKEDWVLIKKLKPVLDIQ